MNLRTYVRYTSHPQCRSLKRTPIHLRRTAEQRQPRDAELRPVRLRSRPRSSEPGLSGHGLPDCAAGRTAHGPFFQPEETCCTRSLVTPRKNAKVNLNCHCCSIGSYFSILCGSCNRLTQSVQNSGSLWTPIPHLLCYKSAMLSLDISWNPYSTFNRDKSG